MGPSRFPNLRHAPSSEGRQQLSDASGTWKITISTLFGAQDATLDLVVDGSSVRGTAHSSAGDITLREGTVRGAVLTIPIELSSPIAVSAKAELTVAGDTMKGKIVGGPVPGIRVRGTRA